MSSKFTRNQKICFWSMYICCCLTSGYSILDEEGWGDAEPEVFLFIWIIWAVVAAPIYYWVKKNPEMVDRFFH